MSIREFSLPKNFELKDGEMKQVSADGTDILVTRIDGEYHAVGAYCPHYGAPLADGYLSGDRIVCPWHHACFDARTGREVEPPAFDSLPKFDLRTEGGAIVVCLPSEVADRKPPAMTKREPGDNRTFAILGGGAAGYMAAQTLREEGFTGRLLMITREDRPPYDRPNLSKDYLGGHAQPEWMPLRGDEFFAEHNIELMCRRVVERVDTGRRSVLFADGETLRFDSLLIATGGVPRTLPFQKGDEENVFLLRSYDDADALVEAAAEGKRAVVIGSSFIGMEAAASLKTRGCDVTVIGPDAAPFAKVLGPAVGELIRSVHEENGVKFKLGGHVRGFIQDGAKVKTVVLDTGEQIAADLVLLGIGVKPATSFIQGVDLHPDGGVIADDHLRIAPDVYAAGDIAHFPDPRTGELIRIEHWRTALQQGRAAARNMAGRHCPFTGVPFFWTTQFDVTLNYVGHVTGWDRVIIQGKVEDRDFLAFYIKDHRILAVAGMNRDRDLAIWEELIRLNRVPPPGRLSGDMADLLNERPTMGSYSAAAFL